MVTGGLSVLRCFSVPSVRWALDALTGQSMLLSAPTFGAIQAKTTWLLR